MPPLAPPTPDATPITDYNEDEIRILGEQGRIDPTGKWVLPGKTAPTKAQLKAAEDKQPFVVPAPPPGVRERIEAAQRVQSSFVQTTKDGEVAKDANGVPIVTADGGAKATEEVQQKIDNPDWANKPKEDPVEWADKERFLGHILGGKPFTKTYSLFGDRLEVTFQTLSCEEQDQCGRQCWMDGNHETAMTTDRRGLEAERVLRFTQYLFTASLVKIATPGDVGRTYAPFKEKGNPDAGILPIKKAHEELRKGYPFPLYNALMTIHERFLNLVGTLTLQASTPDFWSPDADA